MSYIFILPGEFVPPNSNAVRLHTRQACRDFLDVAESHSRRWQKALHHEREQRHHLEETIEQLAKQHNSLERAWRESPSSYTGEAFAVNTSCRKNQKSILDVPSFSPLSLTLWTVCQEVVRVSQHCRNKHWCKVFNLKQLCFLLWSGAAIFEVVSRNDQIFF